MISFATELADYLSSYQLHWQNLCALVSILSAEGEFRSRLDVVIAYALAMPSPVKRYLLCSCWTMDLQQCSELTESRMLSSRVLKSA